MGLSEMRADTSERLSQLSQKRRDLANDIETVARELAEKQLSLELLDVQIAHLKSPPPGFAAPRP